ncbi:MAG: hypothetical protein ACRDO2_11700 [Nocardioidaceae bacterium]
MDLHEKQQQSGTWMSRHEVVLYLVLAYGISWSIWPLVRLNSDSSPLVPFGPGLAALLVAVMAGGLPGLIGLLRQLGAMAGQTTLVRRCPGAPVAITAAPWRRR